MLILKQINTMKTLQNVLLINAISSGATGLLLVFLSRPVATLFAVSQPAIILGVGLFLIAFAGIVLIESRRNPLQMERIRFIILLDRLWVITSLILVVFPNTNLSIIGRVAIVAVAGWVALMAYLQATNLRKVSV